MTKTFYQIAGNKKYRELNTQERKEIAARQNQLVLAYQLGSHDVFEELYDSLKSYIKGSAYHRAMNGYSMEYEDIEGVMNLVLVESLIAYEAGEVPFQAFYALQVNYAMMMLYRDKSKDVHDTCLGDSYRLDRTVDGEATVKDLVVDTKDSYSESAARILADQLIESCFGDDGKKRVIILMFLDGFRQREIAKALIQDGENYDSVYKYVQRTVAAFRQQAIKLV